ncbi:MAG: TorF family putative porin [Pseudobdellovibrio sp.]
MTKNLLTLFYFCIFFISTYSFAAEKQGSNAPTYLVSGDAELMSHFVDRGLSITDQNPALNASFLFNLGQQFKFGFWGSNISNVSSQDDNLWLKIVGSIRIDVNANAKLDFYINDDHYYKSDLRNGQELGFNLDYLVYFFQIEFMNNFQGTKTNAEYLKGGKTFVVAKDTTVSGSAGYTLQQSSPYSNYFDLKAMATYHVTQSLKFDAALTMTFAGSGYGGRGNPFIMAGVKLNY